MESSLQDKGQKYYNCLLPPKEFLEQEINGVLDTSGESAKKNPSSMEDGLNKLVLA